MDGANAEKPWCEDPHGTPPLQHTYCGTATLTNSVLSKGSKAISSSQRNSSIFSSPISGKLRSHVEDSTMEGVEALVGPTPHLARKYGPSNASEKAEVGLEAASADLPTYTAFKSKLTHDRPAFG
ncbi:hypothetical protein M378DRAFT_28080 [Amanita muscaria Koide BX008]|uniref:Uncharacterized protein n=1 Tax=Amanita muscaria (strain Koide BX008) TaxID=946122 RepID=A0A0C2S3C0_AMAMK|nr:hypothetical protein M378DRAFT_28080 [Amanita muscaria Koide BX008]